MAIAELSHPELAEIVGGRLEHGSEDQPITGLAALDDAGPSDISFLGNPKYASSLPHTQAGAVLVPADFAPPATWPPLRCALIRVANPSLAFAKIAERLCPPPPVPRPGVASSAVIGEGVLLGAGISISHGAVVADRVQIGSNAVIGENVVVGEEAIIGADSRIYPNVTIRERTRLGQRVIIHSGAVIGADGYGFELHEGRHVKIPQMGIVQIDNDVEIGANCTIDRARFGRTHIMEGTKIDNLVQIAHNVVIGPHCLIVAQAGISGSTRLGKYVILAAQSGLIGHLKIGDQAVVMAKTGVTKDVPAGQTLFGMVGEPVKDARERHAYVSRLPKLVERVKKLEAELAELKRRQDG